MALSNYTELQAAVRTELGNISTSGISDASIVDAINRAEAKINRKIRMREMEQLAYATYAAGTNALSDRLLALPAGFLEMIGLRIKVATADDNTYEELKYVHPTKIWEHYNSANADGKLRFTLRDQLEMSGTVSVNHTLMMHYYKALDIATDSTNYLLTNYPDVYLYGALSECELHLARDERVPIWKALFEEGIIEINELDERSRDDAELDTSDVAGMANRSAFNILTS